MKTLKTTLLLILAISFLYFYSCQNGNGGKGFLPPMDPNCPYDKQFLRDNELIVNFDKCALINKKGLIDSVLIKFNLKYGYYPIDTCECDSTLILFRSDIPNPDPEERLGDGNEDLVAEGYKLGDAMYNINLQLDIIPEIDSLPIKYYNPNPIDIDSTIIVAVIDGGINKELLNGYLWEKPDSVCGDSNGIDLTKNNTDFNSHGSVVSQLITRGLYKEDIKLMDLRIFDKAGEGDLFQATCAMSFAIRNGANLINTSWGYYADNYDPTFFDQVKKAKSNDIIIVGSAGNDSINTDECNHYPSGFFKKIFHKEASNTISVAYLNSTESALDNHSNWGKKAVTLAAPGVFPNYEGSSFAAPQVTRALSIIKGNNYSLSHRKVIKCLKKNNIDPLTIDVSWKGKLKKHIDATCNNLDD